MATILTTRTYVLGEAAYDALSAVSWPAGDSPGVGVFIGEPSPTPLEFVAVFTDARSTSSGRTSNRLTETLTVKVRVQTHAAHKTSVAAWRRCGALVAAVEAVFRDQTTGQCTTFPTVDGLGPEVLLASNADGRSVQTQCYPTENGWGAVADIEFPFQAVI